MRNREQNKLGLLNILNHCLELDFFFLVDSKLEANMVLMNIYTLILKKQGIGEEEQWILSQGGAREQTGRNGDVLEM